MGLFGLFGPKWKNKKPEVRLAAVRALGAGELGILKSVAAEDEDLSVRLAAVQRIGDRTALEALVVLDLGPEVLQEARARLQPLLFATLLDGAPGEDPDALLARIEAPELLARLAAEAPTPTLRVGAVGRIDDPETLCAVVEQNCGKEPGRAALAKISDPALLQRVACTAASKVTRRLAEEKLAAAAAPAQEQEEAAAALEQEEDTFEEPNVEAVEQSPADDGDTAAAHLAEQERAWEQALAAVEVLVGSQAADAEQLFQQAQESWSAVGIEPPVETGLAERYADACGRFEEARAALEGEHGRLAAWEEQAATLEEQVGTGEVTAADPALADLAARIQAAEWCFLDPAPLLARVQAARERCAARREELAAARVAAALEQRQSLCAELEALTGAEDRAAAARRAKELQQEWKKLPPVSDKRQARTLEERFRAAREQFKISQTPYLEQQEWQRWANRTQQEALCAEMEALDALDALAVVAERIKQAQKSWKAVGPVPRADSEALWQRFKAACDRNFERCKPYLDELAQQRAAALERREELCRQAEEHSESTAWKESTEALKALQAAWKETGAVPRRKDQALFARFRTACDRFFARRQAHFAVLDEKRSGNQEGKEKLCARAEALADAPQREYVKEFRDLQAAWKRAGPAPRAAESDLWQRFRTAHDRFFAWLDEGRLDNLRMKEALCEEVETLVAEAADDADPREIAGQIAELQKRWKDIGPVPQEHSEPIWERFRKPCDGFFAARKEQFAKLEAARRDNEEQKLELLHRAEELADSGDTKSVADSLKQLQQEWNTLGPATREREPELRGRFTTLCDEFFAGRRQHFADQERERRENLKSKEALCVQLERVVGTAGATIAAGENTALSLAEQLQVAFTANFALAGDQDTPERRLEEVQRIQEQWREIGPVPRENDRVLWARYRALIDAFYAGSQDGSQGEQPG